MLLWVEGAPKPGSPIEEVLKYIDQHITARMPDQDKEPELYDLVSRLQSHYQSHSTTCRRIVKNRGKKAELCRFEFPRPACPETKFNQMATELRGFPGTKKRLYSVARKSGEEQWINDYSPAILLAWKGNIDL